VVAGKRQATMIATQAYRAPLLSLVGPALAE
jgi:hypothetical protein